MSTRAGTPAELPAAAPESRPRARGLWRARYRDLALLPALGLLVVVGAFVDDTFLTQANLLNILGAASALALVVLAESLILLTGKFDLSLESTVGLAPAVAFMLVLPTAAQGFGTELPVWMGFVALLLTGLAIGAVNGLLIVRLGLNGFVVTLAMLIVLRGLQTGLTEGKTLFDAPDAFFKLGSANALGVPVSAWVAGSAYAVAWAVLRYHRTGRALYAIGGNAAAARAAGIRVDRIAMAVFMVGGALAAIAGLILAGRIGAVDANLGDGMIFTVFAAAVIGGISLDGGRGSVLGALTGVLLLSTVENLLTLAHVQAYWIQAIYGAIILAALVVSRVAGGSGQN